MRGAAAALAAVLVAGTATGAYALLKAGPNVAGPGINARLKSAGAALPPMPSDVVPFTVFWGLRPYSAAQATGTTNTLRLRRASDNGEVDIKILPTGEVDTASAASHCAATSCFLSVMYDQVGGNACGGLTCNWVQASAALQPAFVFNCNGARPCVSSNTGSMQLVTANSLTPATGTMSLHYVGNRSSGTGATSLLSAGVGGSRISGTNGVATWQLASSSGTLAPAVSDGAWHVAAGVVAGAPSSLSIDGAATSGNVTAFTAAGLPFGMRGGTTTVQLSMEAGIVDNVALSPAQVTALNTGARTAYGLP